MAKRVNNRVRHRAAWEDEEGEEVREEVEFSPAPVSRYTVHTKPFGEQLRYYYQEIVGPGAHMESSRRERLLKALHKHISPQDLFHNLPDHEFLQIRSGELPPTEGLVNALQAVLSLPASKGGCGLVGDASRAFVVKGLEAARSEDAAQKHAECVKAREERNRVYTPSAESFRQRISEAAQLQLGVKELLEQFRRDESRQIDRAWQITEHEETRREAPALAFLAYINHGWPEGAAIQRNQLRDLSTPSQLPNTAIIDHVAARLGAASDDDKKMFRKLVFGYPLDDGQKKVNEALNALEQADGNDKRAAAFSALEHALKERDGLRPKGYRKELVHALYTHALAHDATEPGEKLIPAESGLTEAMLCGTLETLSARGGETNVVRGKIIAAYAFPGDPEAQQRCVKAYAPKDLAPGEAGKSRQFMKGKRTLRHTYAESVQRQDGQTELG